MDYNVSSWTEEVLGYALSVDSFLSSPRYQDIIAGIKLTELLEIYSLEQTVRIWFSGRPDTPDHISDANGKRVDDYVSDVIIHYNNQ